MKSLDFLKEDIVTDAQDMQLDHEVQMARKDCYTAADNAIALHKLLRNISEQQGLEGWVAAKITLASDYLNTVREYLEYQLMTGSPMQEPMSVMPVAESKINEVDPRNFDSDVDYYAARNAPPKRRSAPSDYPYSREEDDDYFREIFRKKRLAKQQQERDADHNRLATGTNESMEHSPVAQSITRRILLQRTDLLSKYGPELVMQAIDEVADFVGNVEEIGSSDVSGWIKHVEQMLGEMGGQSVTEMSAGSVAAVVNPPAKNKAKVGSLFGGTYKQKRVK